jgi:hypothetical protein
MKRLFLTLLSLSLAHTVVAQQQAEIVSVNKIWDKAPHNGFTDLTRFKNLFFCCFREADSAFGSNGRVRIMISSTGGNWVDYAEISEKETDLRDPKLEVTPDGKRLYLLCTGVVYEGTAVKSRRPRYSTTTDGKIWTPPQKLLAEGDTLWRCAVNPADQKLYGVSFNMFPTTGGPKPEAEWSLKSYTSGDGSVWQLSSLMQVPGQPNETTLRFLKDGSALALVRREAADKLGYIGSATAPFREWKWSPLSVVVQGQNFIQLPDGSLIAGSRGRGTTPGAHMVLFTMTPTSLTPLIELPSGGDCSYPGLLWHEKHLWVSYYSSHEGKAAIYLAKLRLPWVKAD